MNFFCSQIHVSEYLSDLEQALIVTMLNGSSKLAYLYIYGV